MTHEQLTNDIRDANLSYLMLAQRVIRQDKSQAMTRLGIGQESAGLIAMLTPAQMLNIANSPVLLCRMKVDDELVWGLLTHHTTPRTDHAASAHGYTGRGISQHFATAI